MENNHETAIAWYLHGSGSCLFGSKGRGGWVGGVRERSVSASFLTLQQAPVDVLVLRFGQCWILVKEIGHKRQVKFGVSRHHVSGRDKLSAAKSLSLLQHSLCPFQVVFLLKKKNRSNDLTASLNRFITKPSSCSLITYPCRGLE